MSSIFSYWSTSRLNLHRHFPASALAGWRDSWPSFQVYGDDNVLPLLARWGADIVDLFRAITIPACKADLARLILLLEHGGLYVDAHCSPGDPASLAALLAPTGECELALLDELASDPVFAGTGLLNSIIWARPASELLSPVVEVALANLRAQRAAEAKGRGEEYSIYKLTGPWIIWHHFFERSGRGGRLREKFAERVAVCRYDRDGANAPVLTYAHNEYRDREHHWSTLERKERLFVPDISDAAV